jgi:hypothetical protein
VRSVDFDFSSNKPKRRLAFEGGLHCFGSQDNRRKKCLFSFVEIVKPSARVMKMIGTTQAQ